MTRPEDRPVTTTPAPTVVELDRATPTPVELTLHRAADAAAPAVLVVPAMSMRASFYAPLLEALPEAGVHAGVVELRGHQRRPAPRPGRRHDHGYADLVGDLDAAVDAVRDLLPRARVLTLGHSLGGHVVAAHAALHPGTVDGAALVATGSVDWRAWNAWHLLRTQAALAATTVLGHFPGDRVGFAGREAPTQMTEWARWARTGRLVVGDPPVEVDALAARVDLPMLALSFAGDALAPAATTDRLVDLFPRARVTREHVHLDTRRPHFDWVRHPALALDHLVGWAGRVSAGSPPR